MDAEVKMQESTKVDDINTESHNTPKMEKKIKEPFMRVIRRDDMTTGKKVGVRVGAIFLALVLLTFIAMGVTKLSPIKIWQYMFSGAFRNKITINSLFKDVAMLLCVSIALAPAFKMKFWNIGAQGQILIGGVVCAIIMKDGEDWPSFLLYVVMFVASMVAGGVWALIPGAFKVKLGANETLFTLMMNYVAIQIVAAVVDKWKGVNSALPILNQISKAGYLPVLFGSKYLFSIIIIVLMMVAMFFYLRNTTQGYEISVVGESLNTAKYAGINVNKVILRTVFISGAICGLCGLMYVAGQNYMISTSTGGSYGFTAIIVAWAAKFNTFTMAGISFFLTFISYGATELSNKCPNLNESFGSVMTGFVLFFMIGCEFFIDYKVILNEKTKEKLDKVFKKKEKGQSVVLEAVGTSSPEVIAKEDK